MKEWNDDKLNIEYRFKTSEGDFVLNPLSGRLIKKGTRTYNRIFLKEDEEGLKEMIHWSILKRLVMYQFQMLILIPIQMNLVSTIILNIMVVYK